MDTWQLLLYAAASLLALRALFGLMTAHKQHYSRLLDEQDFERRKAEKALANAQAASPAEPAPQNGNLRTKRAPPTQK